MTESVNETPPPEVEQGLFVYTDGAANPTNPGNVGFAAHGCLYTYTTPKQGCGNPDVVLSSHGYISKQYKDNINYYEYTDREVVEVTPVAYLNIYGSQKEPNTNQYAELMAMKLALEKANEFTLKSATFITDSEYVRVNISEHMNRWAAAGWVRMDGEPIKNVHIWKEIYKHYTALKLRGTDVYIDRVPGHGDGQNNSYGNNIADVMAVVASRRSAQGIEKNEITLTDAKGYWKLEVDRHPMLYNRRMYFNTMENTQVPGEYLMGEHGTDDELLGKRLRDGIYSVVQLKEKSDILEYVRQLQNQLSAGADSLVLTRVDALFTPEIYTNVLEHGSAYLEKSRDNYRKDLTTIKKVPITKDLNPPLISMRAIDSLSTLKVILQHYRSNALDGYVINDITSLIYDTVTTTQKKGKDKTKEVTTVTIKKALAESAQFPLTVNAKTSNGDVQLPIRMTLGLDMPNRNALKKLEGVGTKVIVITWSEAPDMFKYATIIDSGGDYGIWAAFYSNTVFIPIDYWSKTPEA